MRVKIAYSVELEDVPLEVERILVECDGRIRGVHGDLTQTIGKEPLTMITELDEIRLHMSEVDMRLDDCMQILSGYVQAVANLPELEHGAPKPTPGIPDEEENE